MRARFTCAVLLAVTLLLAATQCVAACAADDCNSSAPPCHQHHGPSNTCHRNVQLAVAHAAPLAPDLANGLIASQNVTLPASAEFLTPLSRSPGDSFILRI